MARTVWTWLLLAMTLFIGPAAAEEPEELPRNLFANAETRDLPNGLRVHRIPVPGDPLVSVAVTVPVGADHDPEGQEELAHLLEHMLLSVDEGQTEEEFQQEISRLGGSFNGFTSPHSTHYFVSIVRAHGMLGIDWLYRAVRPKPMTAEDLAVQRKPVLLEVDARTWTAWDWLKALYLAPPGWRRPGFWRRGFDLAEPRRERVYHPKRSVHRIRPDDLQGFYDRWYSPAAMTLTVAGDLPAEEVWQQVDETFADLPARPVDPDTYRPRLAETSSRSVYWGVRSEVFYGRDLRFVDLDEQGFLTMLFLRGWLRQRLQRVLRHGDDKSTYSVSVKTWSKGTAHSLELELEIDPDRYQEATSAIDAELDLLHGGTIDPADFEEERTELVRKLRTWNQEASDMTTWSRHFLHQRHIFSAWPDASAFYERITPAELAAFLEAHHRPGTEDLRLRRPFPVPLGLMIALGLGAVLGGWRASIAWLRRPIDLTRLRYVARLRLSWPARGLLLGVAMTLALLGRVVYQGWVVLDYAVLAAVDSFLVRSGVEVLLVAACAAAVVLLLSRVPRKLLVLDNGLVLKGLWAWSLQVPRSEVRGVERCSLRQAFARARPWPMSLRSGVLIEHDRGRAWFLRTRDPGELCELLASLGYPIAPDRNPP